MKDIIGFEGAYKIRRDGAVYSFPRLGAHGGWIKPRKGKWGYWYYVLSHNAYKKTIKVHRLVGLHYIQNPEQYKYLNHIDGNKDNNNDWNLEWCTASHNIRHAFTTGLRRTQKGVHNNATKIKDIKSIEDIHALYKAGVRQPVIAEKYGVSQATISNIIRGKHHKLEEE